MSEEKIKILEMIKDGKLTPQEGLELINALEEEPMEKPMTKGLLANRFLRVRVNDEKNTKVNVNIPLSLLKATSKLATLGMGFIPEEARREMEKKGIDLTKIDIEEILHLIEEDLVDGKLVDVDTEDPEHGRTRVEIYVD